MEKNPPAHYREPISAGPDKGFIIGKLNILKYLEVSEHIYKKLVAAGLPVQEIGGTIIAHKENIAEYFKQKSRV